MKIIYYLNELGLSVPLAYGFEIQGPPFVYEAA